MLKVGEKEAPIISIEDISIKFGSFKAVKNVTTSVRDNEIRFFIGPNGAGKTTILDAICGKNKISSGKIMYKGKYDVSKMRDYKIAELGIGRKFQAPSVFEGITIEENMELAAVQRHSIYEDTFKKLSHESRDYMEYVLYLIGLKDRRKQYPINLSHGEKQWLEIGMIMASKPKLMLLDEPVAGMGRRETNTTAELLKNIKKECAVIVVEHDMKFANDISDSVTVFHEGQVLAEGTMKEVQQNKQVIDVYLGRGGDKNA